MTPAEEQVINMKRNHRGTGVGRPFYLTGMKYVDEIDLAKSDSEGDERAAAKKKSTKTTFSNIMGEAQKGYKDHISMEKKRKEREKIEEYERTHERPEPLQQQQQQQRVENALPSLIDLQRVNQALLDGTAFRSDSYRPFNTHRPASPYRPKHSHLPTHITQPITASNLNAILSGKNPRHNLSKKENYTSVSLCAHIDFSVAWSPSDPENRHGTFKPSFAHFSSPSPWAEHAHCSDPDIVTLVKKLSSRIVHRFGELENARLTPWDRRDGLEPRRPPPLARVEREVQNMYSQLHRGRRDAVVEKMEAVREGQAENVRVQARMERERGGVARGADGGGLGEQVMNMDKRGRKGKKPRQIAEEKVRRNRERKGLVGGVKRGPEPVDRYQVTKKGGGKQKGKEATESSKAAKPSRPVLEPLSSDDDSDSSAAGFAGEGEAVVQKQATSTRVTRSKASRLTEEERAQLACISQAAQEEAKQNAQAEAEAAITASPSRSVTPPIDIKEDELHDEVAAVERGIPANQALAIAQPISESKKRKSPPATGALSHTTTHKAKKRKASPISDENQTPKKKGRKLYKSAAVIEDSDDEADYPLPEASAKTAESDPRQEWEAEAEGLFEKAQQQQEKREEEREVAVEKGEEVVVDESIKVVDEGEVVGNAEGGETVKAVQVERSAEKERTATAEEGARSVADGAETMTVPKSNLVLETASPISVVPKGSKRKSPFPNQEEDDEARTESPSSRPIKKAKKVGFSRDAVGFLSS